YLDEDWHRVSLFEPVYEGLAAIPVPLINPVLRQQPKELVINRRWPIKGLVEAGQTLVLRAVADDFDDVSLHKQPGRSLAKELQVLRPQDVKGEIQQAITRVRNELRELKDAQEKALEKIVAAEKQLRKHGKLRRAKANAAPDKGPDDVNELQKALDQNKEAQDKIGKNESEGLQKDVDRIRQALRDNQLPRSAATDKMDSLAKALERVMDHLNESQKKVQDVLKDEEDAANKRRAAAQRKEDMEEARQHQKEAQD